MLKSEDCHGCRYELVDCPYEYDYKVCMDDSFSLRWKKRLVKKYQMMVKDYKEGFSEGQMRYYRGRQKK